MCRACDTKNFGTPKVDRIKQWADALISGEFAQGTGYLRTLDDTYCCLGVACVVSSRNGGPGGEQVEFKASQFAEDEDVDEWFGVDISQIKFDYTVEVTGRAVEINPVEANDDYSLSFRWIANALAAKFGFELEEGNSGAK